MIWRGLIAHQFLDASSYENFDVINRMHTMKFFKAFRMLEKAFALNPIVDMLKMEETYIYSSSVRRESKEGADVVRSKLCTLIVLGAD